jgi:O-antigen/teichoic acid export membrane protein
MLLKHALYYLPTQLLSPLAQLGSMLLWTHWLAPEAMGVFTLVSVMQEMAYLLCLGWFSTYARRYLPAEHQADERQRYLATENVLVLACVAASMLVAMPATWTLPAEQHTWATVCAVGLFFATRALNAHYGERARAQSSFLSYGILQLAGPVGGLGLGWLALQQFAPSAQVLLLSYALAQGLGGLLALPGLGMHWRLRAPDPDLLKAALHFGGPVLGLAALGWVAENHIRHLVQWEAGASALGLMIVGWSLGRRCASVAAMLVTTAAFPLASRLLNEGRHEEAMHQLRINAALMLAVLLPATVAIQIMGPDLATLTVASNYREATGQVLGWSVLAGMLRNLHVHGTDQIMLLQRRMAMIGKISLVEIVACALASGVGLAFWQLRGAVIGQAVGSAVALVLSLWWARRHLGFRWPWGDSARIAAASGAMGLALMAWHPRQGLLGLALWAVWGAFSYGMACAALFHTALMQQWQLRRQRHLA